MKALPQLRGELKKMFARRRTYIGFGAFLVLEPDHPAPDKNSGMGRGSNGSSNPPAGRWSIFFPRPTVGFIIATAATFFVGGIYIALVAGDIVAKESEDGCLRLVLSRPVSRLRVLGLKFGAAVIYTILFILFVGFTAYLLGVSLRGFGGGIFRLPPRFGDLCPAPGGQGWLGRYALGIAGLSLSMVTVTAIAFFFSCMKVKPATATILALSVLFIDFVIFQVPFFPEIKPYLLSPNLSKWVLLCDTVLRWPDIIHGLRLPLRAQPEPVHRWLGHLPIARFQNVSRSRGGFSDRARG